MLAYCQLESPCQKWLKSVNCLLRYHADTGRAKCTYRQTFGRNVILYSPIRTKRALEGIITWYLQGFLPKIFKKSKSIFETATHFLSFSLYLDSACIIYHSFIQHKKINIKSKRHTNEYDIKTDNTIHLVI